MDHTLFLILKTARPRQWIKNFSLFAALVFSGFLFFDFPSYLLQVTKAFVLFSVLSSCVYILNDIIDLPLDRLHPFKKLRPIASGKLPVPIAAFVAVSGFLGVIYLSLSFSTFFLLLAFAYAALHVLYSVKLKHIPILDVLAIATGFIIRVYAGAVVVNLHMSVWFLLTVISASLFLAVGKRQSERTLMEGKVETRRILQHYSQRLLDIYTGMFANTTWLTYALYAFQQDDFVPQGKLLKIFTALPRTFITQKWLMITVPVVIYGVMRYLQLVYEKNHGESPDKVLLEDKPLLASVVLWGILVIAILYL
ncbi:MAG TPA: decaprenyl-phosphate phosphoribosyltransferase [Patescibacteria group bacterium]|nr:decaprenyl-phosphate phosphoribosyltransferase [Patescibacteria group bacterium]